MTLKKKEGINYMTLTQLKYAVCAAGENSMNDAAKKLYISQPSLSGAIASLEKELEILIFNKSKTGITKNICRIPFGISSDF